METQNAASESGPISMSQAAALMRGQDSPEPAHLPTPQATLGRPETAPPSSSAPTEAPPPFAGDDLSPDELGEPSSTAGDEAGDPPPLDPPASFSADEKAAFRDSPRPVQEALRRLEESRRQDHSRRTQEAMDLRTRAEASMRALDSERHYIAQQIVPLVQQLQGHLQAEFSDIRSAEDLARLAESDPARYVQLDARMKALGMAAQYQSALHQQEQAKAAEVLRWHLANETTQLREAMPSWRDDTAYRAGMGEIRSYLSGLGFDEATINTVTDHRAVLVARKAMLYDRAIAKRDAARTPGTPSATMRPGVAGTGQDRIGRAIKAAEDRLTKSGSFEDALALLKLPSTRN